MLHACETLTVADLCCNCSMTRYHIHIHMYISTVFFAEYVPFFHVSTFILPYVLQTVLYSTQFFGIICSNFGRWTGKVALIPLFYVCICATILTCITIHVLLGYVGSPHVCILSCRTACVTVCYFSYGAYVHTMNNLVYILYPRM